VRAVVIVVRSADGMRDKQTAGKYKGQLLTARHGSGKKKTTFNRMFCKLHPGKTPPHLPLNHHEQRSLSTVHITSTYH
jgi:hypothetical protein